MALLITLHPHCLLSITLPVTVRPTHHACIACCFPPPRHTDEHRGKRVSSSEADQHWQSNKRTTPQITGGHMRPLLHLQLVLEKEKIRLIGLIIPGGARGGGAAAAGELRLHLNEERAVEPDLWGWNQASAPSPHSLLSGRNVLEGVSWVRHQAPIVLHISARLLETSSWTPSYPVL
ncbi:unnamed protein product [Pleuronectes platessa]|uniref:Uncharacterized protein n=1 Tax=Pleuronectes platessa TaxID=8262 RepID=A0A9N7V7A4_PLEPL|nr:unnamed protein product [Pleuronectes platessa]